MGGGRREGRAAVLVWVTRRFFFKENQTRGRGREGRAA